MNSVIDHIKDIELHQRVCGTWRDKIIRELGEAYSTAGKVKIDPPKKSSTLYSTWIEAPGRNL